MIYGYLRSIRWRGRPRRAGSEAGSGFESTGEVAAVKVLAVDGDADLLDVMTYALRR